MDQSSQSMVHICFQFFLTALFGFLIMLMTSWNVYISYVEQVEYNLKTGIIKDPTIVNCGLQNPNYTCDFTFNQNQDGGTYTIEYTPFGMFEKYKIGLDYQFKTMY